VAGAGADLDEVGAGLGVEPGDEGVAGRVPPFAAGAFEAAGGSWS